MRILTVVSSIASILGLFISLFCNKKGELSALEWIAIVVFCLSSLYWFIDWFRHRPISYDEMNLRKLALLTLAKLFFYLFSPPKGMFAINIDIVYTLTSTKVA